MEGVPPDVVLFPGLDPVAGYVRDCDTIRASPAKAFTGWLVWDRERAGPGGTRLAAPDHVGVEMAFLAVVSGRATGDQEGVARRQRLLWFLGHAAAWLPKFADALGSADPATGLGRWTAWAADVVEVDLRRRGGKGGPAR